MGRGIYYICSRRGCYSSSTLPMTIRTCLTLHITISPMNRTISSWIALLLLGALTLFSSCRKDEVTQGETPVNSPFNLETNLDARLYAIARQLQLRDDTTNLASQFSQRGISPLWGSAIIADQGIDTLVFIPMLERKSPEEINLIWVFRLRGDTTFRYQFIRRFQLPADESWRFDYFTTFALKKKPKNGTIFLDKDGLRAFKRKCVKYAAGGDDRYLEWRERCWDEFSDENNDGADDGRGNGHYGGGGRRGGECGGGGGGGGGYTPPTPDPNPEDKLNDDIFVTPSFKDSKVMPHYTKLMKDSKLMKRFSKYFKGKKSVAHLRLEVEEIPDYVAEDGKRNIVVAHTIPPKDYMVKIVFNARLVNQLPPEVLATSILHEYLHAHLYATMLSLCGGRSSIIGHLKQLFNASDYPGLADYYSRFKDDNNHFTHELYGPHYQKDFVDIIYNHFDGEIPRNKCEALFWMGLEGTRAYKQLPESKRRQIEEDKKEYDDKIKQAE